MNDQTTALPPESNVPRSYYTRGAFDYKLSDNKAAVIVRGHGPYEGTNYQTDLTEFAFGYVPEPCNTPVLLRGLLAVLRDRIIEKYPVDGSVYAACGVSWLVRNKAYSEDVGDFYMLVTDVEGVDVHEFDDIRLYYDDYVLLCDVYHHTELCGVLNNEVLDDDA